MFSIKSQTWGDSKREGAAGWGKVYGMEAWRGRVPQVCQMRMMRPSAARGSGVIAKPCYGEGVKGSPGFCYRADWLAGYREL